MKTARLAFVVLLAACDSPAPRSNADESSVQGPSALAAEALQLRRLVNALMIGDYPAVRAPVFTYPPMQIPGEAPPKVDPRDPRIAAQDAVDRLQGFGQKAWPYLFERLDDRRQSIAMASEIPCTVGRACFHLIADRVNPRAPRGHFDDYNLILDEDALRLWWEERKGRDLPSLQVEAARFAWALAEFDGQYVDHYSGVLRQLGVPSPAEGAAPWRALVAGVKTPESPEELLPLLANPKTGGFMERRIATERRSRAWWKFYERELASFPVLANGLKEEAIAESCTHLMSVILHPYSLNSHPDLMIFVSPSQASAWWSTRKGRSLRELRLEATAHAIAAAGKKRFDSLEERNNLLEFLREQQSKIERDP